MKTIPNWWSECCRMLASSHPSVRAIILKRILVVIQSIQGNKKTISQKKYKWPRKTKYRSDLVVTPLTPAFNRQGQEEL